MSYVEPIRDLEQVKNIAGYIRSHYGEKYYVMFAIGIYSGLRVSDILKLRVGDVRGRSNISIREKKTGKAKQFPISADIRQMLASYCSGKDDHEYLVPSPKKGKHVSRQYAYEIIRASGKEYGVDHLGTHTMRKTFGYHFYKQTKDIALLQTLFNHSSQQITLRYIGIVSTDAAKAMSNMHFL